MLTVAPAMVVAAILALALSAALASVGAARRALAGGPTTSPAGAGEPAKSRSSATAHVAMVLALVFVLAALLARMLATGHAPWSNMYEFNQAFAGAILGAYLGLVRRSPIDALSPVVAVVAAALLIHALTLPDSARPLPPALQMPFFLTVHVGSAMLAYGIYTVAAAAAGAEIVQGRLGDRLAWLPSAAACRASAHRAVILGLPILTLAIVLGAAWANIAWRSYWNNDPKELAAAATWFIYAGYLHVAGRRDRWGGSAPWLLVLGFGGILFTYFAANLVIPGQHSYSGL